MVVTFKHRGVASEVLERLLPENLLWNVDTYAAQNGETREEQFSLIAATAARGAFVYEVRLTESQRANEFHFDCGVTARAAEKYERAAVPAGFAAAALLYVTGLLVTAMFVGAHHAAPIALLNLPLLLLGFMLGLFMNITLRDRFLHRVPAAAAEAFRHRMLEQLATLQS